MSMTIIIKTLIGDERGSVSIEATFVTLFFVIIFNFSMYQAMQYTQSLKVYKIATQVAELVSQRNIFFFGRDLAEDDGRILTEVLEDLIPDFSNRKISIIIEEQAYATKNYKAIEISPVRSYCKIKKRLNEFGVNVVTSYGKSNAIYRVTVCLRNMSDFISETPDVVVGVAIHPGHHH